MIESPVYKLHKLVYTLDQYADKLLKVALGVSYKRVLFLAVLRHHGLLTQHQLATLLGYSDAAVSFMLSELKKDGYVVITPSPEHGRKKIVKLTNAGIRMSEQASRILDKKFASLGEIAEVDIDEYERTTEQIYQALTAERTKNDKQ